MDHPGKAFYRLSRLKPGDELPMRKLPAAKVYANPLETQALPLPRLEGGAPLWRVLARLSPRLPEVGSSLSLAEVSQILMVLAARGSAALAQKEGGRLYPSAGGAYPLEAYLVVQEVQGVFPGVYHYFPKEHQLFQIASRPDFSRLKAALLDLPLEKAAALLVLTLVPERSAALFGLRGYRYALLEAGYAAGLVLVAATGLGVSAYPAETFYDEEVGQILGLKEGEYPGLAILLGR
ncbi:SagB/ThcOx family dehydrogenase [Thermus filiformis]|uniref:Glucose-1-phosphate adenylyltransferase n=1 Tax=Thermus filiformis TaxID=276 RepID=A0A0A2WMP7_THEFI|nr:SagB/ThcOx family dehydrogenase [Thermus filiformis]KGQ21068.1 glucose-1-phosphate adenylyltransferase [Thermus filiformis]